MGSECGFEGNSRDLLSVMPVASSFQIYLVKEYGSPSVVAAAFDALELALGSLDAFDAALGVVLADRGVEFDDFEGMGSSRLVVGARRCRVFYCDALSALDAAVLTSHVNSYPLAGRGGRRAFELSGGLLPEGLLGAMVWGWRPPTRSSWPRRCCRTPSSADALRLPLRSGPRGPAPACPESARRAPGGRAEGASQGIAATALGALRKAKCNRRACFCVALNNSINRPLIEVDFFIKLGLLFQSQDYSWYTACIELNDSKGGA